MNHNRMARFAVLLAAFNGEKWIVEQVQSILKQKDVIVDLYISVDRSTDKTKSIVNKLCCQFPNIKLLPYGERYGSASRNFFRLISDVDFSIYDYVTLSDQDDIWLDKKLSRAADVIKNHGVSGYSSDVIAFWEGSTQRHLIKKSYKQKKWDYYFESAGPGCSYVLSREAALTVQQVIQSNHGLVQQVDLHDWLIYAIVRCNGLKWHIDHQATLLYRQHLNNEFGANSGFSAWMKRLQQIKSGWYKNQVQLLLQICDGSSTPIRKAFETGFFGRVYLLFHAHKLRRRLRDRFILFFVFLVGAF